MNQNSYNRDYNRRAPDDDQFRRQRFPSASPLRGQDFRGQDFRGQRRGNERSPSPFRSRSTERGNYRQNDSYQNKDFQKPFYQRRPVYCPQYNSFGRDSAGNSGRTHQKRIRREFPDHLIREFNFLTSPSTSPSPNRFSKMLEDGGKDEEFLRDSPSN
jgi:hypothetical protein